MSSRASTNRVESSDAESLPQEHPSVTPWRKAEDALIELQNAPKQELRGRTPNQGLQRIQEFLNTDVIYRELEDYYRVLKPELADAAEHYRGAVEHALAIFERLANRNPELGIGEKLGNSVPHAYRILAVKVFNEKTGRDITDPECASVFRLSPIVKTDLPHPSKAELKEVKIDCQAEEDRLDDIALEDLRIFLSGFMGSIRQQAELLPQLARITEREAPGAAGELIMETLPKDNPLRKHLEGISDLVLQCKALGTGDSLSCSDAAHLHAQIIAAKRSWGLQAIENPLLHLVEEGCLDGKAAIRIQEGHEVLSAAPKLVVELVEVLSRRHSISPSQVRNLSEIANRMRLAGKEDSYIESKLRSVLSIGPEKIAHLGNLAILASRNLKIDEYFFVSKDGEKVIAAAARGDYDTVPTSNSRYAQNVKRAIDANLRLSREPRTALKDGITNAMNSVAPDPLIDRLMLQEAIHSIGQQLGDDGLSEQLEHAAANLTALRRSGADLREVVEMMSTPSDGVSVRNKLDYLSDLASLQRQKIDGVATLFKNSYLVWNARREGDETQDVSGFFVEAKTALRLQANGYKLLALSKALQAGFEYDIVAQSPQGELVGIEVKRSLATILGKNHGVFDAERIQRSQLWRFCKSAQSDGVTPLFAVMIGGSDNWSSGSVGHVLHAVADKLKIKPVVINGMTGMKLKI